MRSVLSFGEVRFGPVLCAFYGHANRRMLNVLVLVFPGFRDLCGVIEVKGHVSPPMTRRPPNELP